MKKRKIISAMLAFALSVTTFIPAYAATTSNDAADTAASSSSVATTQDADTDPNVADLINNHHITINVKKYASDSSIEKELEPYIKSLDSSITDVDLTCFTYPVNYTGCYVYILRENSTPGEKIYIDVNEIKPTGYRLNTSELLPIEYDGQTQGTLLDYVNNSVYLTGTGSAEYEAAFGEDSRHPTSFFEWNWFNNEIYANTCIYDPSTETLTVTFTNAYTDTTTYECTLTVTSVPADAIILKQVRWRTPDGTFCTSWLESANETTDTNNNINSTSPFAIADPPTTTTTTTTTTSLPFKDVSDDHWAYEYISYEYNNGVINGTSSTTFSPNVDVTRAMVVTLLGRASGVDDTATVSTSSFSDVDATAWYAPYAQWAYDNGIVTGDTFNPNETITRDEIAELLYKTLDVNDYDMSFDSSSITQYSDASQINDGYSTAVLFMRHTGIMNGTGNNAFSPEDNVTRAQMSAIVYRLDKELGNE